MTRALSRRARVHWRRDTTLRAWYQVRALSLVVSASGCPFSLYSNSSVIMITIMIMIMIKIVNVIVIMIMIVMLRLQLWHKPWLLAMGLQALRL